VTACRLCYYGSEKGTCRNPYLWRRMGRSAGLPLLQADAWRACGGTLAVVLNHDPVGAPGGGW